MLDELLWSHLHEIRRMFPDIQMVCLFDRKQCPPVPCRKGSRSAFGGRGETTFIDNCRFVRREIATEWVRFTHRYRSKCPVLDAAIDAAGEKQFPAIDKYVSIDDLPNDRPSVIAWANDTRQRVNSEFAEKFEGQPLPYFETTKYSHEKLQSFQFKVGMPVVSIRNERVSKRLVVDDEVQPARFANNDWGVITAYEDKKVTVLVENKTESILQEAEFFNTYMPGFAITVHAAQGTTITWPYAICDVEAMRRDKEGWRLYYTALSRAEYWAQLCNISCLKR